MKFNKTLKSIIVALLIGFITYFGGGEKYISQGVTYVGEKIAYIITGEEYDAKEGVKENRLKGKIIHVSDGDTVILKDDDGEQHKIRLSGIDAPEIGQNYGEKSRDFVKKLVLNKKAGVEIIGTDQYDRILGILYIGDINVNESLLESGLAWQYRFDKNQDYKQLVLKAKIERLNIWSDIDPEDPYVWRKQNKR